MLKTRPTKKEAISSSIWKEKIKLVNENMKGNIEKYGAMT